ncbi:glutaredoxin family protein [Arenicella xantha]|uniref:Glutaredoxin n=1 Tax=Arenicella xantha TaxID=644221 RepID=A0A395JQ26_9GAMM|nr:glutaredoxin family protein [Arenicella xantha]RBP53443.1 glutaredoxin [Arenicella xantha]
MKLPNHTQVLFAALLSAAVSTTADAQKLYKWVDAQGNISYQDSPPPENAKLLDEKQVGRTGGSEADAPANGDPIKVYTVANCALCAQSVLLMIKMGVPHVELPLNEDRAAQSLILEKTSSLIAPTIMIGETILQAPSDDELSEAITAAGYTVKE